MVSFFQEKSNGTSNISILQIAGAGNVEIAYRLLIRNACSSAMKLHTFLLIQFQEPTHQSTRVIFQVRE